MYSPSARRALVCWLLLALGGCSWLLTPTPDQPDCSDPYAAKYRTDGTPTPCYASSAARAVAEQIRACAEHEGTVQVTFDFARDGVPRHVRADVDCQACLLPRAADERAFLTCVERAASAARLPLTEKKDTFRVVYPYRVGHPEDPRLGLGFSPLEKATH